MRRVLVPLVGLSALLAGAAACTPADANYAPGVWVDVTPNTVSAGMPVDLRADCRDGNTAAIVKSDAFGPVTMVSDGGTLAGVARIAKRTPEGTYHAVLTCQNGARARAPLAVLGRTRPGTSVDPGRVTLGPQTGGGFLARNPPPQPAAPPGEGWLAGHLGGGWFAGTIAIVVFAGVLLAVRGRRRAKR